MGATVAIRLRTDTTRVDAEGENFTLIPAKNDAIDLDALTPRARALAEAVAQLPGGEKRAGSILCEHRIKTRGDVTPNPEVWLTPEQCAEPARMTWAQWDQYRADSEVPAIEYLERQARKIGPEWRIVSAIGAIDHYPEVPSSEAAAADDLLTARGVVEYLGRKHDRHINPGTWRAYVARDQAPAAVRRVGREGLWSPADIDAWATRNARRL
jgi:hypothetical protein